MHKRQQGMTFIGLLIVLSVLGLIVFGVIQMIPVYLENMKIVQILNQTKDELDGQNATVGNIRSSLEKRANIESLYDFDPRKDFAIKRSSNGFEVSVDYERRRPYVANVYLLAEFDHKVEIVR